MIRTISYPFAVKEQNIGKGIHIAYMDEGQGDQTFVFIHGLANYAPVWKYQMEGLRQKARCIAIDLPGNGLSPGGDLPYGVFFYAECVKLLCETLELENITLVGHSMGGQIAIMLGLRYRSMFERLALVAPAGIEYFSSLDVLLMQNMMGLGEFLYSDEQHISQAIQESFYTPHTEKTAIISDLQQLLRLGSKQWRNMTKASINSMLNEQVSAFLSELNLPVTLIFGEKDRLIPNRILHPGQTIHSIIRHAEALIPDVATFLLPRAGHFVQIEKGPEVNAILFPG